MTGYVLTEHHKSLCSAPAAVFGHVTDVADETWSPQLSFGAKACLSTQAYK